MTTPMIETFASASAILRWSGEAQLKPMDEFYITFKDGLFYYFVEDDDHYFRLVASYGKDLSDEQVCLSNQ